MNECSFLHPFKVSAASAVVLAAILALALSFSPGSGAESSGTCGDDLMWDLADGALTISGAGPMYDYNNWDSPAPWGTGIESVTVSEGVASIGDYAFYYCSSLSSANIPSSVTSVGRWAFYGCSSLEAIDVDSGNEAYISSDGALFDKGVTVLITYPAGKQDLEYAVPDTVTSIEGYAFANCSSLASVTIPSSVTSISGGMFRNCSSLASVTILSSVTSIGDYAFHGCASLSSLDLPDSLASIGGGAFWECTSLSSVVLPDSLTSIGYDMFHGCTSLSSVHMPSVTSIGQYAFANCSSLYCVVLPDSLVSIDSFAFQGCNRLVDVYNRSALELTKGSTDNGYVAFYAENIFVEGGEFADGLAWALSDEGLLRIDGSGSMPDWSDPSQAPWYGHRDVISSVSIAGEASVGAKAFYGYGALASVDLGSAASIGSKAFSYCAALESLTVPGSASHVGSYAFCSCTGLKALAVEDGVRKIMGSAFSGCRSLESVSLPSSLAYIGANAFHGVAFADQYGNALEPTLKNLRGHDFSRSGKVLRMVTGEVTEFSVGGISYSATSAGTVSAIGYEGDVASVPSAVEYDGRSYAVTSIGKSALLRCPTLTSADLSNVKTLEFKALGNCTGIEHIVFGDCLESVGSYALYGLSFYDGDTKLKATPDNLRGHSFSGTGGKLSLMHTAKILVEDQYGVYFWTEGVGETIADCIASPSPGVTFTVIDNSWGKFVNGINGLAGTEDYSGYWSIYTYRNGEWALSDRGVSLLEARDNPVVGFFYIVSETEAPYDVVAGGPENVAVPSVSDAKVWDGRTDGTVFCIQSESGLYFYVSDATGEKMSERFKAATAAYNVPFVESPYGIDSLFGIGTVKKTDSEGNPVVDPETGYEVYNYWA